MYYDQNEYEVRFEWGPAGLTHLLSSSDVIVIVDVLRFTTAVEIACANGAIVYPFPRRREAAFSLAKRLGAELAGSSWDPDALYSLSPASLLHIPAGTRLIMPSLNGSTLSMLTGRVPTLAGCLRNAKAVATAAEKMGRRVSVIAAGERWEDGALRPGLEDLVGAGAVISNLSGDRSPEAEIALAANRGVERNLLENLRNCSSGRELVERGLEKDIALAAELNASTCVPILSDGAYRWSNFRLGL